MSQVHNWKNPNQLNLIPTPRDRLAPHATRRLGTIVVRNHLVASSEQGPALGLLSTLDTLLVLAFGERSISLLVERNTERFGSGTRGL
jgi:hypothetical protein